MLTVFVPSTTGASHVLINTIGEMCFDKKYKARYRQEALRLYRSFPLQRSARPAITGSLCTTISHHAYGESISLGTRPLRG